MKRYTLLSLALVAACSDTTSTAPTQLNLDRPVDIAFACYGGLRLTGGGAATVDQEVVSTAQPLEACNIRSQPRVNDEIQVPPGQEDLTDQGGVPVGGSSYYGFILQSGPGTVALARWDTKPSSAFSGGDVTVLDADDLTPGKNGITVGEDPIAIATDRVGCYEVVANQGSCDLSVLDINSIFNSGTPGNDAIVNRLPVKNGAGTVIRARPAAMVFEPPAGTIGEACPGTATGLAYIAYPSCHLVAGVDVSTGTIVTGLQFDASGVPTVIDGSTITCPAECDGGGIIPPGFRPVTLDLEIDARSQRRLLSIGADNSNVLTVYDLDTSYRPFAMSQVSLQNTNGHLGVISTAISPLIGMGGSSGEINDDASTAGDHQFVYAVTNDGTVRVVDISGAPVECDTQVDPRAVRDIRDVDKLSCFPVGATGGPPRRAGAKGPGIELTGDAIPTSIDIFRVEPIPNDERIPGTPSRLIGYFGIITAANGLSYVLNIDDDDFADYVDPQNPIGTQIPLVEPNQLRDAVPTRGLLAEEGGKFICDDPGPDPDSSGTQAGGARLAGNVNRTVPTGTIAEQKYGGLPSLRQVLCDAGDPAMADRPVSELFFSAPIDVRESVFQDLRALRADETWNLTYEGSLSLDTAVTSVDGPSVRESQMFVDGLGMRLADPSNPFCEAGVEPYDIVQLRGCDPSIGDAGCPIGYTCYVHPQSQVAGLGSCMLADEAERLANACKPFLTSLRRYTVERSSTGELKLLPRKRVLRTTPTTGCTDDAQCQSLANYALQLASTSDPVNDTTAPDTKTWACQVDPDRRPELDASNQPLKRCLLTCETDTDCATGTVCTANLASPRGGYCMEGVVPPQACVNAPQRYELRAADAFAVVGSRTGYLHPMIADANGSCVKDPNANHLLAGRIPLKAPACDPTADPRTGRRSDGTYEPNPCQTTVDETEYQLNYVPGTCTLGSPDENLVTRPATAIRLRSRGLTLTLVDPTYQGDLRCHGDRAGTLQNVPMVGPGFQISFRQTAGFTPLVLSSITPSFPVKVTRGPGESIWVIDEGDFLSTSISTPSTRGKVYRVESRAIGIVNLLE